MGSVASSVAKTIENYAKTCRCSTASVLANVLAALHWSSGASDPSVSDCVEIVNCLTSLGRRNLAHALASTDALASMQIASDMAQAAGAHSLDRYRDPRDVAWIEQLQQEKQALIALYMKSSGASRENISSIVEDYMTFVGAVRALGGVHD